ncbi:MAG: carbohydrate ABC transporter permease [Devosia sp.]|uniref:carbohydrate ABC transporter permease n=1 Tax=Devosia sp. 66-22 TaxID=1895753 RepID=UPI000AD0982B|nr:carbohydrate ABC transporter permease [Devosia sp. 66-22]MBN9347054.1 carbohydrate ABC transporter permease [Devosia sp.]
MTSVALDTPVRMGLLRWRLHGGDLIVYALNILVAALFLLPWIIAITISLLPETALKTYPPTIFAWPPDFGSYVRLLTVDDGRFLGYLRTSAVVAGCTAISVVLVSGMAGYALSKIRFAGRELFFVLILGTLMFPFTTVLIPLFSIMSQLKLVNNPVSLVILYTVVQAPFCTFLFRNSFSAVPDAVRESALVDGANEWQVLVRVMIPLALPALATVLIYSFYQSWNEFTIALIFLTDDQTTTVPIGLVNLTTSGRFASHPNMQMAGAVMSFLPILVLFLLFQRFFVSGIISGSTKG